MEETTTPRISLLLSKIQTLNHQLTRSMNQLVLRLDYLEQKPLELSPALYNIVDRKAEKDRRLKSKKVTLKEIVDTAVEYEQLG